MKNAGPCSFPRLHASITMILREKIPVTFKSGDHRSRKIKSPKQNLLKSSCFSAKEHPSSLLVLQFFFNGKMWHWKHSHNEIQSEKPQTAKWWQVWGLVCCCQDMNGARPLKSSVGTVKIYYSGFFKHFSLTLLQNDHAATRIWPNSN